MKNLFLIAAIAVSSTAELAAASTDSKHGFVQRGLKLRTQKALEPNLSEPTAEAVEKPAEKEGRTWIKITNVSKLWPKQSSIPVVTQYFFALTWVCMIGSLPLFLPFIDGKPVTFTQKVVGVSMLVVLFGGLYLFTNIILFQSGHFEGIRPLTMIECIYFMSQVITTVGYGDITPAKPRGQVFVALYVLGALFVIAMLVSQVIDHFTVLLQKKKEAMFHVTPRSDSTRSQEDGTRKNTSVHDLLAPDRPSMSSLLVSLAAFALLDIVWVGFFSTFPGENKTVFEAFYMSLITLTTVGFGAITPLTEGGMIFAAFFMLVGSASIVNVIGKFCEFVSMMNEFQRFSPEVKKAAVDDLKQIVKNESKVTESEFFRFVVLYENVMTEDQVGSILEAFESLKPQNGVVDFKTVEDAMDVHKDREQYFDQIQREGVSFKNI